MNFLGGSLPIGRLFGVHIRVHMLFILWIGFQLFQAGHGWPREALFWGLLFGIILLHEFGHCFGARAVGGYADHILMWPLGGLAYARAPMRPWPQFVTVAAGPLVNVVLCALSALVMLAGTGGALLPGINPFAPDPILLRGGPVALPDWLPYVFTFYHVNLWLLAFNLLPIFPLDGGQLFQAALWPLLGLQRAAVLACQVGLVGCGLLLFWAVRGGGGGILFFIAIFGGLTCWQQLQAARHGLLVEESRFHAVGRPSRDPRPWWQRILHIGGRRRRGLRPTPSPNPNPGGWDARQQERAREDAELDRILQKVSEQGIHSLSYIERQTLERITRERQSEEREFQRDTRL